MSDTRLPLRDRFRDPKGWLIDSLPWFARKLYVRFVTRCEVPDSARLIGFRRPPQHVMDAARKMAIERGWADIGGDGITKDDREALGA